MRYFLGIEVGSSKTHALIADALALVAKERFPVQAKEREAIAAYG